jgi:hypothetical protein|tara:strand:- start:10436 stop:10555 length:120 start_codon:yes stop_codon:yes gene_type:complete
MLAYNLDLANALPIYNWLLGTDRAPEHHDASGRPQRRRA